MVEKVDLGELNSEQQRATQHVSGPLLVVAGAGTGKTKVITTRIARLIATGEAKPSEILALTFTEKAAGEMADRLGELIGWQALSVAVMTFNGFGASLLGEYSHQIGRNVSGGLLNDTQKSLLLLQRYDDIDLIYFGPQTDTYGFVVGVIKYIGDLQNAGVSPQKYHQYAHELQPNDELSAAEIAEQVDLASFYSAYESAKLDTGTFDYYDQLAIPLEIFRQRPNIASRLSARYKFVLVDEYQDTSPVQDELLRQLVPPEGNLFAVGDDDQAIYGFRGADINNILNFTEHYKVAQPLALIKNYRSGQPILDAAYRLIIGNNPERLESILKLDKKLIATNDAASVVFRPFASPQAELDGVTADIVMRLAGGASAGGIAILARSNAKLREYAAELRNRKIPFAISTAVNIFEQRELKNLWYIMRWIGNLASESDIAHVSLGPFIGWTAAAWQPVVELSKTLRVSFEAALRKLSEDGDENSRLLIQRLEVWREWSAEMTVLELAYAVVFRSTGSEENLAMRMQHVAETASGQVQSRVFRVFDDLGRFFGQVRDFVTIQELTGASKSLAAYLERFPLPPTLEVSEIDGDADGVQLLTVHASKGLEFPVVYVVNTTDRSWSEPPTMGALEVPQTLAKQNDLPPIHEQRRLMYVAATRAKTELIITAPIASAGGQKQRLSGLITELLGHEPGGLLDNSGTINTQKPMQKLQRFYPLQSELPDRLPFERADGWIHLGVSDLYSYSYDPYAFMIEKVLKMTLASSWNIGFGVLLHGLIQAYYEGVLHGARLSLDDLIVRLHDSWNGSGFESAAQAQAGLAKAESTIRSFYQREQLVGRVVESVEHPFKLDIAEAKLRISGRIDAMFRTPEGLEVRDFKTGDKRDPEKLSKAAKDSFQLRTYALALQELSGTLPAVVTLDYVVTGAEGSASFTPLIMKNHRTKLITLAEELRARKFEPRASAPGQPSLIELYYGEYDE